MATFPAKVAARVNNYFGGTMATTAYVGAAAPAGTPTVAMPLPGAVITTPATTTAPAAANSWLVGLEREARALLDAGTPEVWEALTRQFEARLIVTALDSTRGRRIEAAQRLGIGRNTITRKIQELGLDD